MADNLPHPKQRWLLLAHCFNMDGRAASQTITDRLPILLTQGVEPVVISAPTGTRDERFPHCQVFSVAPSGLLFEGRQIIEQKTRQPVKQDLLKALLTLGLFPVYLLEKIFVRLDSHWSWALSAAWRGRRLIRELKPSLIYSTGGPSSAHLAGYWLHRRSGLPWLVELHDPLLPSDRLPRNQQTWFHRQLEKLIAAHANAVFFFTEQAAQDAIKRQPALADKTTVLRPGAAPPDFSGINYQPAAHCRLAHFGSLAPGRNLKIVFAALADLLRQHPELRQLVRLDIYGTELDQVSASALATYDLHGVVVRHGRLEHDPLTNKSGRQRIMEAMRQSDILLLLHGEPPDSLGYIPSKLYEYLLTNRPILGLVTPGSELESILRDAEQITAAGHDQAAVTALLAQLIRTWQTNGLPDRPPPVTFSLQEAVAQLTRTADRLLRQPPLPDCGCYVLHVKQGYEERARNINKQFARLGLDLRWILEHDIPEISPDTLQAYRYHGSLRPQEISCCLKHISVWEQIAHAPEAGGIVFEDDVLLDLHNFLPVSKAALAEFRATRPGQPGCICFGDGCALYVPWTKKQPGRMLYPAEYVRAADSYWLSRETAARMVDWVRSHGFARPADHLIDQICAKLAIPIFWTDPTVVSQGTHIGRFQSGIQTQEHCPKMIKKIEWLWKKTRRKYLYPLLGMDFTKK